MHEPPASCRSAAARAPWRRVRSAPPRALDVGGDGARQPTDAAGDAGEDRRRRRRRLGAPLPRRRGACGREQAAVLVRPLHQLRHGRMRGDLVGAAGIHPAEQRLDQPVADLAARAAGPRAGRSRRPREVEPRQPRARAGPAATASRLEDAAVAPATPRSAGMPISVGGSGRTAPRVHTPAPLTRGCTTWSPSPTARARSVPSGRRLSIDSAPRSTGTPATSPSRSLPPTSVGTFEHRDLEIGPADQERPGCGQTGRSAPPTTATLTGRRCRRSRGGPVRPGSGGDARMDQGWHGVPAVTGTSPWPTASKPHANSSKRLAHADQPRRDASRRSDRPGSGCRPAAVGATRPARRMQGDHDSQVVRGAAGTAQRDAPDVAEGAPNFGERRRLQQRLELRCVRERIHARRPAPPHQALLEQSR